MVNAYFKCLPLSLILVHETNDFKAAPLPSAAKLYKAVSK